MTNIFAPQVIAVGDESARRERIRAMLQGTPGQAPLPAGEELLLIDALMTAVEQTVSTAFMNIHRATSETLPTDGCKMRFAPVLLMLLQQEFVGLSMDMAAQAYSAVMGCDIEQARRMLADPTLVDKMKGQVREAMAAAGRDPSTLN